MLKLVRMEKTAVDAGRVSVSLNSEVENCLTLLKDVSKQREILVINNLTDPVSLNAHPELIHTLIINLITNAMVHSPFGSSVEILVAREGRILGTKNLAPNLAQEDLPRMFDRLWQHDSSRSNNQHYGLGLSLARSCADALGLKLTASLDGSGVLCMCLGNDLSPLQEKGKGSVGNGT